MKTVVISGASSEIGKFCALKFLQNNYFVYNLDINDCNSLINKDNYRYIKADVKDHESIRSAIREIVKERYEIDILIVSAEKHLSANVEDTTDEELFDILSINLCGCFWLIKETIPHMRKCRKGKIITIGSDQCLITKNNLSVYGMTKAALLSLTKSIALDYAKYNITANCISAGTIDTPPYKKNISAESCDLTMKAIEQEKATQQPIARVGRPEEVAILAFFLASEKVNGQFLKPPY